jgi:putative transposase
MGRPRKHEIELTETERASLSDLVRSRAAPQGLARRAQMVLASAEGASNTAIAREVGLSSPAVGHWRKRFLEQGLAGLYGEQRPGRPRNHDDAAVAHLLTTVLQSPPALARTGPSAARPRPRGSRRARWSAIGDCSGSSRTAPGPSSSRPTRYSSRRFGTSSGSTLTRPITRWSCASTRRARFRHSSARSPSCRYVDGITHDYKRHGTTTLFAALDVANGQVLAQCKARHRHQEFLAFLRRIDTAVPVGFDVHLVVDNYATHKHPRVRAWLAKPPRFHVHYTPTYASWLNQVERWFAILTSREIRRGSLGSAKDLIARITAFVAAYSAHSRPFAWTATADDILAKIARVCNVISGTSH